MTKKNLERLPLRPTIRKLAVGEKAEFPIVQLAYAKSSATDFKTMYGLKYRTHQNIEKGVVEITRIE
ncbi:MAG: hypothetical protein PUF37_00730 [Prevotellaceae bacterium]|nr:hypothetical protein [Prevotellaceae bacterium]